MIAVVTWDEVWILLRSSARGVIKKRVVQRTTLKGTLVWKGIALPVLTLLVSTEGGFFNDSIFAIGVESRGQ